MKLSVLQVYTFISILLLSILVEPLHAAESPTPLRISKMNRKFSYGSTQSFSSQDGPSLERVLSFASVRGGAIIDKNPSLSSPPLNTWIIPALTCAISYALYNISIKKASDDIDPVLGGVLLQIVAAGMGMIIYFGKEWASDGSANHVLNQNGIVWSIAAGICVGLAEILSFVVSGKGVKATQSIPIIIGGSVLFGTVFGLVFLKEAISCRGWIGVFLISIGITIIGMEPGQSMH